VTVRLTKKDYFRTARTGGVPHDGQHRRVLAVVRFLKQGGSEDALTAA
jgi:hypothetical protein